MNAQIINVTLSSAITLLCLQVACLADAPASSLSDDSLMRIQFEQRLNRQVSLDLTFHDESGKSVQLSDYFGGKPVILVLGYYGCPMLCTLVMNGMVESLQDLRLDLGDQFNVVSVSIDPQETPELAAAKRRTYLKRYGRAGAAAGWHFLTGEEAAIRRLANEVGFHYAYDPGRRQYAHPSGLIVLTPDGKVSRYLFGVNYPAKELNLALKEAGARKIGSPIGQLILRCFHYSPLTGKYGNLIMATVRAGGAITLLALGTTVAVLARRRRQSSLKESAR